MKAISQYFPVVLFIILLSSNFLDSQFQLSIVAPKKYTSYSVSFISVLSLYLEAKHFALIFRLFKKNWIRTKTNVFTQQA